MTADSMTEGSLLPLSGLVVADFTRILAGPLCTLVLADMGARVIKIERQGTGDDTRTWGPPFLEGDAAYFLSVNRNKESIALDLRDADDLGVARDIVDRSDVLVENFRSNVMDELGLGYEEVSETNPDLVYCSMPAFAYSEHRNLPGYDLMMQAYTGFMSITGEQGGEPVKMGVAILDEVAGLYAAVAILTALHHRARGRGGRRVQVGLFEASVSSLVNQAANYLVGGVVPSAFGSAHPNIVPYQAFPAKNGRVVLAAANDKLFRATCEVLKRPDLASDPRYATNSGRVEHRDTLIAEMSQTFQTAEVDFWADALGEAGVPAAPIRGIDEVFAAPEGEAMIETILDPVRGTLRLVRNPIEYDGFGSAHAPPPRLGEHEERILSWVRETAPLRSR